MSDGGKGSRPRPFSISQDQYSKNWENIFGSKNEKNLSVQSDQTNQSFKQGNLDVSGLQKNSNGGRY